MISKTILSLLVLVQISLAIEKPDYQVLSTLDSSTEIRKYSPSKWVSTSTNVACSNLDSQRNVLFSRLFGYITGQNDQGKKIEMTAPVLNEIKQIDAQNCMFTMRFYIPKADQLNTPVPTGNAVLTDMGELSVAVARFSGFANMNDFTQHSSLLKQRLGSQLSNYDSTTLMTAGYNAPYELERTNEVWMKKL